MLTARHVNRFLQLQKKNYSLIKFFIFLKLSTMNELLVSSIRCTYIIIFLPGQMYTLSY